MECRVLIIDEISKVGSQQLAAVSERLRQCADAESSFGGVGVVFSGDFAQLPPIGQRPLIYNARPGKRDGGEKSSAAAALGEAGRRRFDEVDACVRLRVVYRQGEPCPFKESIMRLRDGAMTHADYNLWKTHDIMDTANCDEDIARRADGFLWLCAENADAGARNGRKLGQLAAADAAPILRYDSTPTARPRKA